MREILHLFTRQCTRNTRKYIKRHCYQINVYAPKNEHEHCAKSLQIREGKIKIVIDLFHIDTNNIIAMIFGPTPTIFFQTYNFTIISVVFVFHGNGALNVH